MSIYDQTNKTPDDALKAENTHNAERMRLRLDDGVIIWVLKIVLHCNVWHLPYRLFVRGVLWAVGRLHVEMERPVVAVWIAADAFMIFMTALNIVCFFLLFVVASSDREHRELFGALLCFLPLFRLLEIFSVVAMLHTTKEYNPPAPMRAASKTFWAYGEFVLIFACFYLFATIRGDHFTAQPEEGSWNFVLTQRWINAL